MVKRNVRRKSRGLENIAALIEEGFQCYERGNKPGAEKKLHAACAIRPPVPQAHYNLGYFYNLEGRWDEAEEALLKALEHQPDYSRALFTLASVYMEAGRLDRAQAQFLATERLTPDDLDIQLNLGILAIRAFCTVCGQRVDAHLCMVDGVRLAWTLECLAGHCRLRLVCKR